MCEEGGTLLFQQLGPWFYSGPAYPDSLGINATNWALHNTPATINDVSEANQVRVASEIQGGRPVPDQSGCTGSW